MPDPGSRSRGESGQQTAGARSDTGQSSSKPSSSQGRQKAGGDLQSAGERVASAGDLIGQTGAQGQSGTPASDHAAGEPGQQDAAGARAGGNQEIDPLIPESDSATPSDDLVFDDAESGSANGELMSEDIEAAQDALVKAGIRLREAGEAVANAETDAEMARARELLADARVIVIVAGQELMEARETAGEEHGEVYDEAQDALDDATVAIVVATGAIEGMPDFQDLKTAGTPRNTELEDELEDTLGDFDKKILTARRTVLQPGPGGQSGYELPPADDEEPAGKPGLPKTASSSDNQEEAEGTPAPGSLPVATGGDDEQQVAAVVPDDIGPGNDDDIVAQQLREAAIAESDPELREKLWEEYRRYKSGL